MTPARQLPQPREDRGQAGGSMVEARNDADDAASSNCLHRAESATSYRAARPAPEFCVVPCTSIAPTYLAPRPTQEGPPD